MIVAIILFWILTALIAPTWIWGLYWVYVLIWIISVIGKIVKWILEQ